MEFTLKLLAVLSLLLPLSSRAENCRINSLNCQHLANILLTPKGIERILKEQLDVSLVNKQAHSEIKESIRQRSGIVVFKSNPECEKELSPIQHAERMAGLKTGMSGCLYYPVLQQIGSDLKPVKFVLFQVRLDNFDLQKSKFAIEKIECPTAQTCHAKVSASQISAVGQILIETLDGKKLEAPRLELTNKAGQTPASAQFNLELRPSGEMIAALGTFDKVDLQLERTQLKSVIVDEDGQVLSKEKSDARLVQEASRKRAELFKQRFAQGDDASLADEVSKYNEQQKIKGLPQIPLSTFQGALTKWKKNQKGSPEIFNQLPSFQSTSENGAAQAKGFSNPATASLFTSYVDLINQNFASDPKIQALVKNDFNKGLKQAESSVNQVLSQISGDLGRTFIQTQELPVADIANLVRLNSIEKLIADTDNLLQSKISEAQKSEAQIARKKLEEERKTLNAKLENGKSLVIVTQPFFDQLNDMNRIGLFAGGQACPAPTQILKQGITDKSQLNGAEFGFELTKESLQAYIDEVYASSPVVCLGSILPDCKGGESIKLTQKPKLNVSSDGKYRLQLSGMNLENTMLSPTIGISVDLNVNDCKSNRLTDDKDICLSFGNSSVDQKSSAIKLHDAFSWVVKTSDQQVKEGVAEISEINLSKLLPNSVSSSFEIQSPTIMGPQGLLVFPMNLKAQDQRTILGKLN